MNYPIKKIRSDFPILQRSINEYPFVYLDNAATTQKPNIVINSQSDYYKNECAAAHRSVHSLSVISTDHIERVRSCIANFINASKSEEIVFVKSTTEAINLVANSWGRQFLSHGDNIIISEMEHHSNILPWQILSTEKKIELRCIPLLSDGTLDLSKLPQLINNNTKLVAITHISNILGTVNPLHEIIYTIRAKSNAVVLIDGAQGIVHQPVDVQQLDCDFYVFSGHKIYGPAGIGIMYGKQKILNIMQPWIVGGGIIQNVSLNQKATFLEFPWKFESGSPNVGGIIALGSAIKYFNDIGINNILTYEKQLMSYTIDMLSKKFKNLTLYGPNTRSSIIAFNLDKYHSYDIGTLLNQYGIAIRTGHHCAIPIMKHFKVQGMCRVSFAIYTDLNDINQFINGLTKIQGLLLN